MIKMVGDYALDLTDINQNERLMYQACSLKQLQKELIDIEEDIKTNSDPIFYKARHFILEEIASRLDIDKTIINWREK